MMSHKVSKITAITIALITEIISFCIGNIGLDYDKMELGALANMIVLPILLATTLLLFALIDWAKPKYRLGLLVGTILVMLWLGIQLRIDSMP